MALACVASRDKQLFATTKDRMSRYRKVLTRIWEDNRFPYLSADEQRLFLYHLTSPRSTPFLLYVEGAGAMGDALRMPSGMVAEARTNLMASGMAWYDDEAKMIFLPKALKLPENAPEGPNSVKTWVTLFRELPAIPFRDRCVSHWLEMEEAGEISHAMSRTFLHEVRKACGMASSMASGMGSPIQDTVYRIELPVTDGANSERRHIRAAATEPGVHEIIQTYHDLFLKRYGAKPNIDGGKDGAIVKRLLKAHGREKVLELLGRFFESTDPFIEASGRTIGVFASVWNKLITQQQQKPKQPAFRALNITK